MSSGIAISITAQLLSFLFTTAISGFLAFISVALHHDIPQNLHLLEHVHTIFHFFSGFTRRCLINGEMLINFSIFFLTLRLSINIKHLCLIFHSLPILNCFRAFRPGINVATTSWFWSRFPDENLKVLQYHYNFIFPKICNVAFQFLFLINIIYSVWVKAKRLLNWKICSSLPEQRKGIFDLV